MSTIDENTFEPETAHPLLIRGTAIDGMASYEALVEEARADRSGFWARLARENLVWHRQFSKVLDDSNAPFFKWFDDGLLNASYNCLDRHLHNGNAEKTAIIFEADDSNVTRITYRQFARARAIAQRATCSGRP